MAENADRIRELTELIDQLHEERENARNAVEYARIHNLIAEARVERAALRNPPEGSES